MMITINVYVFQIMKLCWFNSASIVVPIFQTQAQAQAQEGLSKKLAFKNTSTEASRYHS
jgi:hypothetical protein